MTASTLARSARRLAAIYIAERLAAGRMLVSTDRHGYDLAVALARQDGPEAMATVHALLAPHVHASLAYGQRPPRGWNSLAARIPTATAATSGGEAA